LRDFNKEKFQLRVIVSQREVATRGSHKKGEDLMLVSCEV
jgi:hypothetical protein